MAGRTLASSPAAQSGPVSLRGTAAYDRLTGLPPLVEPAAGLARQEGFESSCRPEHGRLLFALAAGAELIGETGTGCGVGLAIDDLTPAPEWPPRFEGQLDEARMHWLTYPGLDATELRLAPDLATLVATRRWPSR